MVVHYSLPKIKITVTRGGTDYQLEDYHTVTDIFLVENGIWQAVIRAADRESETFLGKADIGDNVKVEIQFADKPSPSWTQRFGGWVFDLNPTLTQEGEILTIQARGYGLALAAMLVGEEYGSQSRNPLDNTIQEILWDASDGIIPKWVEKVLKTATSSGYAINTTKVANVGPTFRYLYWPYKPALNCIDDMIDLASAAGNPAHWIVKPDGTTAYLCVATVGNHENPPADVWPTWWNTDEAGSTIEVKKDMIVSSFTKQRSDANYILYHGKLRKPPRGDTWTENNKALWGKNASTTLTDDNSAGNFKVGSYSLKASRTYDGGNTCNMWYPSAENAAWTINNWGGEYNIPVVFFHFKCDSNIGWPVIHLFTSSGNSYWQYLSSTQYGISDDEWRQFLFSVGPNYKKHPQYAVRTADTTDWDWSVNNSPNWGNINEIYFAGTVKAGTTGNIWVDGLEFNGWIIRGARDDTKIGTQKARVKLIVDDIGKDDSGVATDDSYVMAQLAKAELYRSITTPVIGTIVMPGKETIWPGQKAHIHFAKKSDTTFRVDSDMRVLNVHDRFAPPPHGFRSYLTLTDDLTNSRALQPTAGYNLLLKATNPSFQNRERASQKARQIDITQTILSKNYST